MSQMTEMFRTWHWGCTAETLLTSVALAGVGQEVWSGHPRLWVQRPDLSFDPEPSCPGAPADRTTGEQNQGPGNTFRCGTKTGGKVSFQPPEGSWEPLGFCLLTELTGMLGARSPHPTPTGEL